MNNPRQQKIVAACIALLTLAASVVWAEHGLTVPPAQFRPSVPVGAEVYEQQCSSCHGAYRYELDDETLHGEQVNEPAPPDCSSRTWRWELSPAVVASITRGLDDHPVAAESTDDAWHATAFVWALPMHREEIRQGVDLVEHARDLATDRGFLSLLSEEHKLRALQNRAWVLTHSPAAVEDYLFDIAGDELNELNEEQQAILIDHIFVTHFEVPEGWRPW
jgi:hypothetical protein